VAELDDGHDVQDAVDTPVPGPGQAVALLVAGGGVQGCGAVPGGEVPAAGEAADVTDVADQPGGTGRADAVQLLQAATAGRDQLGQLLADEFGDQFRGQAAAGATDEVTWADGGEQGAGLVGAQELLSSAG
jgi:hypothetical protein